MQTLNMGKGVIVEFDPKTAEGKVKTSSGKTYPFNLNSENMKVSGEIKLNVKVNFQYSAEKREMLGLSTFEE